MSQQIYQRIRDCVTAKRLDVSKHAFDEMADDGLLLIDVETAILTGAIVREDTGDIRGTVYVIEGLGCDQETTIGVAVRFNVRENLVVITTYRK